MTRSDGFLMLWTERPVMPGGDAVYDLCWFARADNCIDFDDLLVTWSKFLGWANPPMRTKLNGIERTGLYDVPIAFLGADTPVRNGLDWLQSLCKRYGYCLYLEKDYTIQGGRKVHSPWASRRVSLFVFKPGCPSIPQWVYTKGQFLYAPECVTA